MSDTTISDLPDMATCPLHAIDPMDPALMAGDPSAYYRRLRHEAPVYRDLKTGIVWISTYPLVVEALRQPEIFSSDIFDLLNMGMGTPDPEEVAILARGVPYKNTMHTADAPEHSRYKRLAVKAFTYQRVEQMSDYIAEVSNGLIDRFIGSGQVEFKQQFADLLPSTVVADLLGIPRSDIAQLHIWLNASIVRFGGHMSTREARIDAAYKRLELQNYLLREVNDRRANPRDDAISDLVRVTLSDEGDPRPLDDAELLSILVAIFNAGQETTAHSLTAGLYYLLTYPDQLAQLREDPTLLGNFVEETLRYLTPVNNMWRRVKKKVEFHGVELDVGDKVLLRFGSADRDEAVFADGDSFNLHRDNVRKHLAFGGGSHICLGAMLARKEMMIAFEILLRRLKNLRLAQGADRLRFNPSPVLRGVQDLHLEFDAEPS